MRGPLAVAGALLASAAVLCLLPSAQAGLGLPDPLTERGAVVDDIYQVITVMGIIVFVIVFVWLVAVIWRYRETTGHGRATHERERHNIWAELAWFVIPLIMVLSIGYMAYAGLVKLDHGIADSEVQLEVKVVGSQWNWAAQYPNGVVINSSPDPNTGAVKDENVFIVPANVPIRFNVTASDVIHAFQVVDNNTAYVMFVDANPLGANKYNMQSARLPAGDYFVQCNKMCMNPGHAYMKARLKAVPQAEYDHWLAGHGAAMSPDATMRGYLVQSFPVSVEGGALVSPAGANGTLDLVANTRVVLDLAPTSQEVTFSVDGQPPKTIQPGAADSFYGFDAKTEGTYVVRATSGGQSLGEVRFRAVKATPVTVNMRDFSLDAPSVPLKVGETYFMTAPNLGGTTHDVHIGKFDTSAPNSGAIDGWHTPAVPAGGVGSFVMTPEDAGTFDLWCNQPGHVGLGMKTTVTVSA